QLEVFTKLAQAGLIIPVMSGAYRLYPQAIIDLLAVLDHISLYEFEFYRNIALNSFAKDAMVCDHCVEERESKLLAQTKGQKNAKLFKTQIHRLLMNIHPFLAPDFELVEDLQRAITHKDLQSLEQLVDYSGTVHVARTAQAYGAALVLRDDDISNVPTSISVPVD